MRGDHVADDWTDPWQWRKADGGWTLKTDPSTKERLFHAYDVNHNAACQPSAGLVQSCEEPNEGSPFCPACVLFVTSNPSGREKRFYA